MGIDAISDLGKVQLEIIASLDLTASVALQLFVLLDDFELGLYIRAKSQDFLFDEWHISMP